MHWSGWGRRRALQRCYDRRPGVDLCLRLAPIKDYCTKKGIRDIYWHKFSKPDKVARSKIYHYDYKRLLSRAPLELINKSKNCKCCPVKTSSKPRICLFWPPSPHWQCLHKLNMFSDMTMTFNFPESCEFANTCAQYAICAAAELCGCVPHRVKVKRSAALFCLFKPRLHLICRPQ